MKQLLIYICIIIICTQCAQITPLTGGKKDITAPKLLFASPQNASTNFNQKKIELEFDEYVALKDLPNQLIITPQLTQQPEIQALGKKIKITFSENLTPNTTYKISFGNAIVDIKESNAISNFEYVFSTGNSIDSLKIKGIVINALTNKSIENVLVGLYASNAEDSVIYKEKPMYISKTNSEGLFSFNYLSDKKFKIIGINDRNKNLLYDGSTEEVSFIKNEVSGNDTDLVQLKLFKELENKQFIKKTISNEYGKALVVYNKSCKDITTVTWEGMQGVYYINKMQDSVTLFYENAFDTLKVVIHRASKNDTLIFKIPSRLDYEKLKTNNKLKYAIKTNISSSFPYYEVPNIQLNFPISKDAIQKDKITFIKLKDSLKVKQAFELVENEKIINSFEIKTLIEKETSYELIINKGVFIDSTGRSNDSITFKFNTTSTEDYGILNLKLSLPKKETYLISLINDKDEETIIKKIALSLTSSSDQKINFENLKPGTYFIKVIEDANKNGQFDTGNYFNKTEPEKIFINYSAIKVLSGWEIENDWIVK